MQCATDSFIGDHFFSIKFSIPFGFCVFFKSQVQLIKTALLSERRAQLITRKYLIVPVST